MHTSWTTPQSDNRVLLSLDNSALSWTVIAPDKVTAVPVRRNGNFQTPISVPCGETQTMSHIIKSCPQTLACLNYTLQMMMPLPGWRAMAPNAYDNNNSTGTVTCYSLKNFKTGDNVFDVTLVCVSDVTWWVSLMTASTTSLLPPTRVRSTTHRRRRSMLQRLNISWYQKYYDA